MHSLIRELNRTYPLRRLQDYCIELQSVGITVSRAYICRLLKSWGLTYKKAEHKEVCSVHFAIAFDVQTVGMFVLMCITLCVGGMCVVR